MSKALKPKTTADGPYARPAFRTKERKLPDEELAAAPKARVAPETPVFKQRRVLPQTTPFAAPSTSAETPVPDPKMTAVAAKIDLLEAKFLALLQTAQTPQHLPPAAPAFTPVTDTPATARMAATASGLATPGKPQRAAEQESQLPATLPANVRAMPAYALGESMGPALLGTVAVPLFALLRSMMLLQNQDKTSTGLAPSDRAIRDMLPAAITEMNKRTTGVTALIETATREQCAACLARYYSLVAEVPENAVWLDGMWPAVLAMQNAMFVCQRPYLILNLELTLREQVLDAIKRDVPIPDVGKSSPAYAVAYQREVADPIAEIRAGMPMAPPPYKQAYRAADTRSQHEYRPAPQYERRPAYEDAPRRDEPFRQRATRDAGAGLCRSYNRGSRCYDNPCKWTHRCNAGCQAPNDEHAAGSDKCPLNPRYRTGARAAK